jgi:hypothetical protein
MTNDEIVCSAKFFDKLELVIEVENASLTSWSLAPTGNKYTQIIIIFIGTKKCLHEFESTTMVSLFYVTPQRASTPSSKRDERRDFFSLERILHPT